MTANRDFDDIARAWLNLMPDEAPDRIVESVRMAVDATPQVRPRFVGPRRFSNMSPFALVGAAAIIAATGAFLALTRPTPKVGNQPTATPASVAPSSSGQVAGDALDAALRASWIAVAKTNDILGNGSGPVSFTVDAAGTGIAAGNFGPGLSFPSTVAKIAPDRFRVVLTLDVGGCHAFAQGVYRWSFSPDRSLLTLTTVSDECTKRVAALGRTWARSLVDPTTIGAGVVDTMEPNFAITLPDDRYTARTLDDFIEIGGSNGYSLMVFKNPQAFVDACSTDEKRVPYTPGAAAFVASFRSNDAFTVSAATPLKIDGHDVIHVVIGGKSNYARCPGAALYEYTPKACVCHFIVGPGGADSMYLVDVGPDTFMFVVSPFGSAGELDAITSIRIPFILPTQ
jgi:hypothetical protein